MRLVKIGLASLNPTVGAMVSNGALVRTKAREMSEAGCAVGAFTELVLCGYPPEDLVQWRGFVDAQWNTLTRLAEATSGFPFPTVFVVGLAVEDEGLVYNTAAVVAAGRIVGLVPKENLPTYDVFYERRVFSRGIPYDVRQVRGVPFGDLVFELPFGKLAVEVCEDLWVPDGPMLRRGASGAELLVNISSSPWRGGVVETRRELIATRAADHQATIVYVNQYGGQDALVFDGGGYVNQNGRMVLESERWRETVSCAVVDLDRTARLRAQNTTWRAHAETLLREDGPVTVLEVDLPEHEAPGLSYPVPEEKSFFSPAPQRAGSSAERWYEDLIQAMKTGLVSYFEKSGAFKRLGVALSGGKDSALTLIIAWLYARERFDDPAELEDFIHCFSMPTRFNSDVTKDLARKLAEELGVRFTEAPIEDAFAREVAAAERMLPEGETLSATTRQNIQARLRALRMWSWANACSGMWLQSGNMSEKAVGYTTIGGDLMGAYSLLGNLPKTIVVRLLTHLETSRGIKTIAELLETKASAELAKGQEDEKDLMPFPVLDACFALFASEKLMPKDLYVAVRRMWTDDELRAMAPGYRSGQLKAWVRRFCLLFVGSIFKWVQAPLTVHLGQLDLDRDRALQLPAVQSREWLDLGALDALPD